MILSIGKWSFYNWGCPSGICYSISENMEEGNEVGGLHDQHGPCFSELGAVGLNEH